MTLTGLLAFVSAAIAAKAKSLQPKARGVERREQRRRNCAPGRAQALVQMMDPPLL